MDTELRTAKTAPASMDSPPRDDGRDRAGAVAPQRRAYARMQSGAAHRLNDKHAAQAPVQPSQLQDVAPLGEGAFATVAKAWCARACTQWRRPGAP